MSSGEFWQKYGEEWQKLTNRTHRTFQRDWGEAQEELKTYQNKVQTEKERVSIEIEKEAVKQGLKTKIDRVFTLQKLVDDCLNDLEDKNLSLHEKNQTRKTIKELQSEISKIEGDYATNRIQLEGGENPIKVENGFLSPEEEAKYLQFIEKEYGIKPK